MTGSRAFRVWIVGYENWQPAACDDVPPTAVALEPACEGTLSMEQSARFMRGFNEQMLRSGRKCWAIRRAVEVRYDGDLAAGQPLK